MMTYLYNNNALSDVGIHRGSVLASVKGGSSAVVLDRKHDHIRHHTARHISSVHRNDAEGSTRLHCQRTGVRE